MAKNNQQVKKVKGEQVQAKPIKKVQVEDSDEDSEEETDIIQFQKKAPVQNKVQAKGNDKKQQFLQQQKKQVQEEDDDDDDDEDEDDEEEQQQTKKPAQKKVQQQQQQDDDDDDDDDDDEGNDDDDEEEEDDDEEEGDEDKQEQSQQQEYEIKVKGISFDATKDELEKFFNTFTKVKSVNLLMRGDKNKGLAFIKLQNKKALDDALKNNKIEHLGRYLDIEVATSKNENSNNQDRQEGGKQQSKSIFVGNLSFKTDDDSLRELFEECGEIVNVKVATDRETGKPRGFGHVDFADEESAKKALKFNGNDLDGRQIRVDLSLPKGDRQGGFNRGGRGGHGGHGGRGGRGGRGGNFRGGDRRGGGRGGRGGFNKGNRGGNRGGFKKHF